MASWTITASTINKVSQHLHRKLQTCKVTDLKEYAHRTYPKLVRMPSILCIALGYGLKPEEKPHPYIRSCPTVGAAEFCLIRQHLYSRQDTLRGGNTNAVEIGS